MNGLIPGAGIPEVRSALGIDRRLVFGDAQNVLEFRIETAEHAFGLAASFIQPVPVEGMQVLAVAIGLPGRLAEIEGAIAVQQIDDFCNVSHGITPVLGI